MHVHYFDIQKGSGSWILQTDFLWISPHPIESESLESQATSFNIEYCIWCVQKKNGWNCVLIKFNISQWFSPKTLFIVKLNTHVYNGIFYETAVAGKVQINDLIW